MAAEGAGEQDSEATAPEESLGKPSAAGVCLCEREIDKQTDRQTDKQTEQDSEATALLERLGTPSVAGVSAVLCVRECVCVFMYSLVLE